MCSYVVLLKCPSFLWKLVFVYFSKTWQENSSFIKPDNNNGTLPADRNTCWIVSRSDLLRMKNLSDKNLEKIIIPVRSKKFFGKKLYTEARPGNRCCSGMSSKCYIIWVCVCSPEYLACNAHAPYFYLWRPAVPHFSTLSHTRHNFLEKALNLKSVLPFSLQRLSEKF